MLNNSHKKICGGLIVTTIGASSVYGKFLAKNKGDIGKQGMIQIGKNGQKEEFDEKIVETGQKDDSGEVNQMGKTGQEATFDGNMIKNGQEATFDEKNVKTGEKKESGGDMIKNGQRKTFCGGEIDTAIGECLNSITHEVKKVKENENENLKAFRKLEMNRHFVGLRNPNPTELRVKVYVSSTFANCLESTSWLRTVEGIPLREGDTSLQIFHLYLIKHNMSPD